MPYNVHKHRANVVKAVAAGDEPTAHIYNYQRCACAHCRARFLPPAALLEQAARELGAPLMREQWECLSDPARVNEALDMIDDWESRLNLSCSLRGELAAWLTTREAR